MKQRDQLLRMLAAKQGIEFGAWSCPRGCTETPAPEWVQTKVLTGGFYTQLRPICAQCGSSLRFERSRD